MSISDQLPRHAEPRSGALSSSIIGLESQERCILEGYERELTALRRSEKRLQQALARVEYLLRQKDEFIQRQEVLTKESDHRLLNGLQIIASLLSLQSRASKNADVASKLAAAADRIAAIGRIHHRLHSSDGVPTFTIKQYLEDICRDFSTMLSFCPKRVITVEGIDANLPAETAIPLGFIANELITNAAKHGTGRITVILERTFEEKYALSVSSDGPGLPQGFDPADCKGLGMRIIRALIEQIGGELSIDGADGNHSARFTVLFPCLVSKSTPAGMPLGRRRKARRPADSSVVSHKRGLLMILGSSNVAPLLSGSAK
jgi:two-component system, sensor histidine kinase PdtaS